MGFSIFTLYQAVFAKLSNHDFLSVKKTNEIAKKPTAVMAGGSPPIW